MPIFRNASFLALLSPAQRLGLLKAQAVFAKEQTGQKNAKCSERFPDFKSGNPEVPCGEDEQPLLANT